MEASALLILSGHFGGFLPSYYAQRWVETGEMRPLRPDVLAYSPDFFIVTRKGAEMNLAAKTFLVDLRAANSASRKAS
jgi:DNA-binding transcriptional LysR family regulator